MLKRLKHLLLLLFVIAATAGAAAQSDDFAAPMLQARLITAQDGIAPAAGTISAGLEITLEDGWKTYWRSPGEVGLPPEMDWSGSENVATVDLLWPAPERFTAFGIENFGYHEQVVFPLGVTLQDPGQPVALNTTVFLLVCAEVCVPVDFDLSLKLDQGNGIDAASAARIATFSARVPVTDAAAGLQSAAFHMDPAQSLLTLSLTSDQPFAAPDIFPEMGAGNALGRPDIRLGDEGRLLWAAFPVLGLSPETLTAPALTITDQGGRAFTILPDPAEVAPPPPYAIAAPSVGLGQLAWIAAVAFVGGMILNVMPCVLPVLSIKLSQALVHQGRSQAAVRAGFLAAAAGVMAFMWGLAAILFGLQQMGATVGWGLQFQNPVFLALMCVLLAVFAANLFGLFEFGLPSSVQTRMATAGGPVGYGADFLTGLFGAVMATPCSAPFLGTAIAFALAGTGLDIAVVFTCLGLGLALPYLIGAALPGIIAHLPKPGRWMLMVKLVLGAMLALTALWLLRVLTGVAGVQATLAVGAITAALVGLLAWRRGPAMLRGGGIMALCILPLIAANLLAQDGQRATALPDRIAWVAFDRAAIARRVSQGEVVFVDVTADWCLTCKANKSLVLDSDAVAPLLNAAGIVPMLADWTRSDPAISRYLEGFGRYGIPFNAVYGPSAPDGIILSEVLTAEAVIAALDQAAGRE